MTSAVLAIHNGGHTLVSPRYALLSSTATMSNDCASIETVG